MSLAHLKASIVYLGSTVLVKSVSFLMIPFLTARLAPSEYGVLGLFVMVVSLGGVYVGLRPEVYLIKIHAERTDDQYAAARKSLLILAGISAFFFFPVSYLLAWWLLPSDSAHGTFALLCTLAAAAQAVQKIFDTELQIELRAKTYAVLQMLTVTVHVALAVMLIDLVSANWQSKAWAEVVAYLTVVCVSFYIFRSRIARGASAPWRADLRDAVAYLWPLTFHVLGFSLLNLADRAIIADLLGTESVGLYSVAYMFGMIVGMVHDSALKAWNPYFFKAYRNPDNRRRLFFQQAAYGGAAIVGWLVFVYVQSWLFPLMVDPRYQAAADLIPIVALAYTFEGIRKIICGYLYVHAKTKILGLVTSITAVLNIVLTFSLIPHYGLMGAAYATLVCFVLMTLVTGALCVKFELASQ